MAVFAPPDRVPELLAGRRAHVVHLYESDGALADLVARLFAGAVRSREPAVVVASAGRLTAIRERLASLGCDVDTAVARGALLLRDADKMFASVVARDVPDRARFDAELGAAVVDLARGDRLVRAYCELADVAWRSGAVATARAIEELCAELGARQPMLLLCGYALEAAPRAGGREAIARVCGAHDRVISAADVSRARAADGGLAPTGGELLDFVETAPLPMCSVSREGTILWANRAQAEMLGDSAEALVGASLAEVHADPEVLSRILGRLAVGETVRDEPARLRRRDGTVRHVVVEASASRRDGQVASWWITRDVTERKAAEEALRRLRDAMGGLAEASTVQDVAGVFLEHGLAAAGAYAGSLFVAAHDGATLEPAASRGYDGEIARRYTTIHRDDDLPLAVAFRARAPLYFSDRAGILERFPQLAGAVALHGSLAQASVPLLLGDRAIGVMGFSWREPVVFDDDRQALVSTLAHQCALALERVRLRHEERAARDALSRAHDTLRAMVEASPIAMVLLDADGSVSMWNDAATTAFGWRADEAIGAALPGLAESARRSLHAHLARVGGGERVLGEPIACHRKNGERFDARLFLSPVAGRGGRPQCLALVLDVTDRERDGFRQKLLADASAILASSLETSDVLERLAARAVQDLADWAMIDLVREDGSLERVALAHADPAQAELAARIRARGGPRPGASRGAPTVIAGRRSQLVCDVDDAAMQDAARDADHLAAIRAIGIRSYVMAPLVVGGRVLGVISLGSSSRRYDESDLALAEELARRAATTLDNAHLYAAARGLVRRLEDIQAVTSDLSRARTPTEVAGIVVRRGASAVDAGAAIVWLREEDGSLRMLDGHGLPEAELAEWRVMPAGSPAPAFRLLETGEPMWVETEDDFRAAAPEIVDASIAAGRVRAFVAMPLSIGGARRGVVSFTFPLGHRFGEDEKRFLITLARQCEQAIERAQLFTAEAAARRDAEHARALAEQASRAKDEFLAMLGHELRNPLSPIVTALQLMKLRGDVASSREQRVIERQVQHLLRLVDDLLDISRITRGKVALRTQPVELCEAVAKAVEMASPLLEQKRHRFSVHVPRTGMRVEADVVRLAQVVANLLTNAAKYTEPGGTIVLQARREGTEIALSVTDDGTGIDPELLPRVFDLFVQGARDVDRTQGGLGIGLALVRNLVALHGGTVEARSEGPGKGSEFAVRLPALPIEAAETGVEPPPEPTRRASAIRILVVDDNRDAAEMLADVLRDAGHEVTVAFDGPSALESVASRAPEVAILDIGLPAMDGYELAERLRERVAGRLRLFALTGYGQERDRERSRAAGFSVHFVKPVDVEKLLAAIER